MAEPYTILNVAGPYREPHEPVFSYDYSVQRPTWPTPHGIRVKVAIAEELDHLKLKIVEMTGGSPGQQLLVNQLLSRQIADRKLEIANEEGMFTGRLDVMIEIFTGSLAHLFPRLETWMKEQKTFLREEIQKKIRI